MTRSPVLPTAAFGYQPTCCTRRRRCPPAPSPLSHRANATSCFGSERNRFPRKLCKLRSFLQPLFFFQHDSDFSFLRFFSLLCRAMHRPEQRSEESRVGTVIPARFVLSGDYFRFLTGSHAPVKYASNNAVVTRFYDFLLSQLCPTTTTTALRVHTKLHLAAEIQACFLLFLRGKERLVNRDAIEETRLGGYTRVRPSIRLFVTRSTQVLGHLVDLEKPTNPEREGGKGRESTFTAVLLPRKCLPDSRARKSVGHEKVSRLAL